MKLSAQQINRIYLFKFCNDVCDNKAVAAAVHNWKLTRREDELFKYAVLDFTMPVNNASHIRSIWKYLRLPTGKVCVQRARLSFNYTEGMTTSIQQVPVLNSLNQIDELDWKTHNNKANANGDRAAAFSSTFNQTLIFFFPPPTPSPRDDSPTGHIPVKLLN